MNDLGLNAPLPEYLKSNIERIKSHPSQSLTEWSKQYEKFQGHPFVAPIYKKFQNRVLNRADVVVLFQNEDLTVAATAAMMWGAINVGKGHFARFLDTEKSKLTDIMNHQKTLIENGEIAEAFRFMQKEGKLGGVGHPYFTKLFFFTAVSSPKYDVRFPNHVEPLPLIFDKWTKNAFYALLMQTEPSKLAEYFGGKPKTPAVLASEGVTTRWGEKLIAGYMSYLTHMAAWSRQLGTSPQQLEEFVFGTSRRIDKSETNPRNELIKIISEGSEK